MNNQVFNENNIVLNASFDNKWDALRACGQILVDNGYVKEEYIDDILEREKVATTYIGNNISIPHGVLGSEVNIHVSGISFLQVPNGVEFGNEKAYMLIGIAGKDGEHLDMLARIAFVCCEMDNINLLRRATDKAEICKVFENIDSIEL